LRLVFMGTPDFAVPALAALIDAGHDIAAVYTQPPRPAGRGMAPRISAVHRFAAGRKLSLETPSTLKERAIQQAFAALAADAAVVVAYGLILPGAILDATRLGAFNIHASLLPRWRGAAPIQRAIMAGDARTGVTIMRMDESLDEGQICHADSVPINALTTAGELHDTLADLGARLMREALVLLNAGQLGCAPQPSEGVTYARKITKTETAIDFAKPAIAVRNHIHGLSPSPGAWFAVDGDRQPVRVKALLSEIAEARGKPGEVLDDRLTIACGEGAVRMLKVQREGRTPMIAEAFLRGTEIPRGTLLGLHAPLQADDRI
jgi:methionyl-tRNA formyltransferase